MEAKRAKDLKIGDIDALLKDYKRVVEGVMQAGGFESE